MDSNSATNQKTSSDTGNESSRPDYQFDWLNWFYWNMWWQQYSYWMWTQSLSQQPASDTNRQQSTSGGHNQYYQYNPFYHYANPAVNPAWANYQGQPPQSEGGVAQLPQANGNFLTLQIRIINGFETYIAATWKRLVAEVIDTFLFALLLKAYLPEADLRIPEVLFEGSEVWAAVEEEELLEIQEVLQTFIYSVFMQRMHHAIMEAVWIAVFSCTPGKWLMGLRVLNCSNIHLTRTQPGYTIRIVPGTRITIWRALIRSVFKAFFSLFCPLLIFFFSLFRGQTKYDRVLRCAVVDARSLYRPVHSRGPTTTAAAPPPLVHVNVGQQ